MAAARGGSVDSRFWNGRRVLVTGHTGFKGAWMSLWLQHLGALVTGFSRGVPTRPSLYEVARVEDEMRSIDGDVCDYDQLRAAVVECGPEIVIHMAAQPLVRRSYAHPRETYAVNTMGTVNLLDAVRTAGEVRVVLCVTSDKCYANPARGHAHREDDPIGGSDPYSSSKACAEFAIEAYRRSFFAAEADARIASVRAGNVFGGGDWGEDRLVPDLMRAALDRTPVLVRNPLAVRPWQHVLNPLSGYLVLAQSLWDSPEGACAWNFGPSEGNARTVQWVVERVRELWAEELEWARDEGFHSEEAAYLDIDSSKARTELGWRSALDLEQGLEATVEWYRRFRDGEDMRAATAGQIAGVGDSASAVEGDHHERATL